MLPHSCGVGGALPNARAGVQSGAAGPTSTGCPRVVDLRRSSTASSSTDQNRLVPKATTNQAHRTGRIGPSGRPHASNDRAANSPSPRQSPSSHHQETATDPDTKIQATVARTTGNASAAVRSPHRVPPHQPRPPQGGPLRLRGHHYALSRRQPRQPRAAHDARTPTTPSHHRTPFDTDHHAPSGSRRLETSHRTRQPSSGTARADRTAHAGDPSDGRAPAGTSSPGPSCAAAPSRIPARQVDPERHHVIVFVARMPSSTCSETPPGPRGKNTTAADSTPTPSAIRRPLRSARGSVGFVGCKGRNAFHVAGGATATQRSTPAGLRFTCRPARHALVVPEATRSEPATIPVATSTARTLRFV